jgi:REP element-mobilizing transposase RayT
MRDFDDNDFPLAYLITFRCYGTWPHGDKRGSMDRKHNIYGTPKIARNSNLQRSDIRQLKHPPITLNAKQRNVVKNAVREVCNYRKYLLRAINVRTNHVHSVVSAMTRPEPILDAFKSYSTRALRNAGLISEKSRPWIRHGSTIYLWKERDVAKAIEYVMLEQGDDLFLLDDGEDDSK